MKSTKRQSPAPESDTAFTNRVKASGPLLAVKTLDASRSHAASRTAAARPKPILDTLIWTGPPKSRLKFVSEPDSQRNPVAQRGRRRLAFVPSREASDATASDEKVERG